MIKVENIEVFNFEGAIRGMRNPLNSWCKSDSYNNYTVEYKEDGEEVHHPYYRVGATDLALMRKLYKAGTEHRKFMRQIIVSMDITAPLYWIAEFDTYKIGTTRNSCSFMHKGISKPFEITDFSVHDNRVYEVLSNYYKGNYYYIGNSLKNLDCAPPTSENELFLLYVLCYTWRTTLDTLNKLREEYLDTKDNNIFQQIRCILPSGYNQKFTVTMNYENVANIIKQRKNHKLDEWREFCEILLQELPYLKDIMEESGDEK